MTSGAEILDRAFRQFDAGAFAKRHGGFKESQSARSHEYLLTCPKCGSDRLRWRHEPEVRMAFICWGCRITGDTIALIRLLEDVDEDKAIDIVLGEYVGGDAPVELSKRAEIQKPVDVRLRQLPRIPFPSGYERLDWHAPAHRPAWRYLLGRGMTTEDVITYQIGYARRGRLARYVIFPCFMDGSIVYWQARATWDPPAHFTREQKRAWEKETRYRKTLNPIADTAAGASEVLFNFDRARAAEEVVIVEGPVDAIKVGTHAVALFGKNPGHAKVALLLRLPARRFVVYLDRGEEERAAAYALARELAAFVSVSIAEPPEGYDPGSLTKAQNAAVLRTAVLFREAGLQSNLRVR